MKNDQIIIYVLIAILFGYTGYLIYCRMKTKEKYIGQGIISTSGNCSGNPQQQGYPAYYQDICYQNCFDVFGQEINQVNNPDGTYTCYSDGCPSSDPFIINPLQGLSSNVCYSSCPPAYPKTAGMTCVNSCKYDGQTLNNESVPYLLSTSNTCVSSCPDNLPYYYFDTKQNDNICVKSCPKEAPNLYNNSECVSDCSTTPNPNVYNNTCVTYPGGSWINSCSNYTYTDNGQLCATCNTPYWYQNSNNYSCVRATPSDNVVNVNGILKNLGS